MNRYICLLTILCLQAFQTSAQVADTLELKKIVVTASKFETTERLTTKVVDVITLKDIQNSGANDLAQLLQQQNGLLINGSNSNPGKDKAVYLRGAGTQYTVVLIDGYPISDPSSEGGAFDLRLLPLSNVERVEIVKGSMSTLYGSDAIAGVINIITKKPENESYSIIGRTSIGSFNDQNYQLGVSGRLDGVGYSIHGSIRDIKGISDAEEPMEGGDFDADGFNQQAFSAALDIPIATELSIQPFLNIGVFDGNYDNGAFSDANNTFEADFLNLGTRFQLQLTDLNLKGAISYTDTERMFVDAFGAFNPNAQLLNADVFGYYNFAGGYRMLAGIHHQQLNYQLDATDVDNSIISPYVSTFINTDFGLGGEFGIRLNKHTEFGTHTTFNLAPVYNVNESIKLLISYSTGFKSPTLNELFGPFGSNRELKPQKSATFDVGGKFYFLENTLQLEATYFSRTVEDLILYAGFETGYINTDEQNDYGIEVSADYNHKNVQLSTFYNFLDGKRNTPGGGIDNLIRRPNHSFGVNVQKAFESGIFIAISSEFIGKRKDLFFDPSTFTSSEVNLDSYVLVNARSSYRISNITLFGDLKNILNTDYFEVYGFSTPGIHFNIGVQFDI